MFKLIFHKTFKQKQVLLKQNDLRGNLIQMLTHDLKESILSLYVLTNKLQCNNDNLKIVLPKIKKQLRNSNEMINSIVELAKNESVIQIGSSEILNSIHLIHENYSDRMISKK